MSNPLTSEGIETSRNNLPNYTATLYHIRGAFVNEYFSYFDKILPIKWPNLLDNSNSKELSLCFITFCSWFLSDIYYNFYFIELCS